MPIPFWATIQVGTDVAIVNSQRSNEYSKGKEEEMEMAIATMLLDPKYSVNAWRELSGVFSRGDPKPFTITAIGQDCTGRARNACHRFAAFFKIGHGYDWEEQYTEYSKHWRKYLQAWPLEE